MRFSISKFFDHWLARDKHFFLNEAHKAKYLSPDIQNELIELAGEEVLSSILSRARIANKMCRRIEY